MKKYLNNKRTIFEAVLILLVILLAGFLAFQFFGEKSREVTLTTVTPNGSTTTGPYPKGSLVALQDGPAIDGYIFSAWKGEDGEMVEEKEIYLNQNTTLTAVYGIAFKKDHVPFLTNEEGVFRPEDGITRAECAEMFYTLLDTDKVGSGSFEDVKKTDSYYTACATLKDLGVFSGNYFHPEDTVTHKEFSEMLSAFSVSYLDNMEKPASEEEITRAECADIMCAILGRTGDSKDQKDALGTFLDVSPNREDFWAIAESTVKHEYTLENGKEVWTKCESFPEHGPGFFFVGTRLHYIDENGNPVIDGEAEGLTFNDRGEETSGDEELDKMVQEILKETVDPATETREEMLKDLYNYVVYSNDTYTYVGRNSYEVGDTSWVIDEAKTMLTKRSGNCYNFAAMFYELARAIGYDMQIYSGQVGPDHRAHAWTELEDADGTIHLYDTEYEYANPGHDMFDRDESVIERYKYLKEPYSPTSSKDKEQEETEGDSKEAATATPAPTPTAAN